MVVSDYSSILPGILLVKIPLGTKSEKRKTGNKNKKNSKVFGPSVLCLVGHSISSYGGRVLCWEE